MKFLTLADFSGFTEVSLFNDAYNAYGHLTLQPVVAVTATADPFDNRKGCSLNATHVALPKHAIAKQSVKISTTPGTALIPVE